jgi:hypothetical protein
MQAPFSVPLNNHPLAPVWSLVYPQPFQENHFSECCGTLVRYASASHKTVPSHEHTILWFSPTPALLAITEAARRRPSTAFAPSCTTHERPAMNQIMAMINLLSISVSLSWCSLLGNLVRERPGQFLKAPSRSGLSWKMLDPDQTKRCHMCLRSSPDCPPSLPVQVWSVDGNLDALRHADLDVSTRVHAHASAISPIISHTFKKFAGPWHLSTPSLSAAAVQTSPAFLAPEGASPSNTPPTPSAPLLRSPDLCTAR